MTIIIIQSKSLNDTIEKYTVTITTPDNELIDRDLAKELIAQLAHQFEEEDRQAHIKKFNFEPLKTKNGN